MDLPPSLVDFVHVSNPEVCTCYANTLPLSSLPLLTVRLPLLEGRWPMKTEGTEAASRVWTATSVMERISGSQLPRDSSFYGSGDRVCKGFYSCMQEGLIGHNTVPNY